MRFAISIITLSTWMLAAFSASANGVIDNFSKGWVGGSGAKISGDANGRPVFHCPMSGEADRYIFDRTVAMDLSSKTSLEIKLSCPDPAAIREVSLYLESEGGWFVVGGSMVRPGSSTFLFTLGNAETDGKPTSWAKIKRLRLALWKGVPRDTYVQPISIAAYSDRAFVIRPTSSTPKADQKWLGRASFDRVDQWLTDAGVRHGVLTDDEVKKGKMRGPGVAILPFNPVLDWAERKYLTQFVSEGGRLIVCRGEQREMAALMGVKIGSFKSSGEYGRYDSVKFTSGGFPPKVRDHNWEIVSVTPDGSKGRVVAQWVHANGSLVSEPACIESKAGFWFSHVLRSGDQSSKQQMLLQMIGSTCPEVWHQALTHLLEHPLAIPIAEQGVQETLNYLSTRGDLVSDAQQFQRELNRAGEIHSQMRTKWESGNHAGAYALGQAVRTQLLKCFALSQAPVRGELRGVWDHNGTGLYAGGWDETCKQLAGSGINAIFPNMMWSSKAHYPSKILPASKTLSQYGDQVAQCVTAAKKYGMGVHVWKVCWQVTPGTDFYNECKKAGRLQQNDQGETISWLSPSHPANRAYEINAMKEVITRYPVQGIHLDYIRYPDRNSGYSSVSRKAFERYLGIPVPRWPADAKPGGKYARKFEAFRAREISTFVAQAYKELKKANPKIQISAAVFGSYPDCITSRGQDWGSWLKAGTIDFVAPMNYTENPYQFTRWVRDQMALPGAKGKILPGIGVISNEAELRADQVIEQINVSRDQGARGYLLFKLDAPLVENTLPYLRIGVNR